jgi:hypothetical protein
MRVVATGASLCRTGGRGFSISHAVQERSELESFERDLLLGEIVLYSIRYHPFAIIATNISQIA